jgi:hypothetical protein
MTATLRSYKFVIPAGEKREYPIRGDSLRVINSSVPVFFSSVDGSTDFYLNEGEQARFNGRFEEINIYHNSVSEQIIELAVGEGAEIGSALLSGSVAISQIVNNGAAVQSRVNLTNVNQVLLAANENRKYLLIQNNDAAAVMRVTLNGSAATAAQGFRIDTGASLELSQFNVTGEINAIMESATAASNNVEFAEG